MRQVPHYLIIGNGRVARHFQHYFSLLSLPYTVWHRQASLCALEQSLAQATHVLLLISDQAIEHFIADHLHATAAQRIHFSGSVVTDQAYGAHPLMTFGPTLYALEAYQAIPFMVDSDAPSFDTLLPGLPNPSSRLDKIAKAKYHALCVLSGNFSCLLWQKFFDTLENEFHLSSTVAFPYLRQQMHNLMLHPTAALTGPLVRGDHETIAKNLCALESDPFQLVYQSFVSCFQQLTRDPV